QVVDAAQKRMQDIPEKPAAPRREAEETHRHSVDRLRGLVEELDEVGCELKDWQTGLIDFPSIHDGKEIYLCWRLGEATIQYWHGGDAGYNGRQAVDATF